MLGFTITLGLFGVITTILWLVIGWRAMKAHEALASEAKKFNQANASTELRETKRELSDQKKLYHQFIRENPEVDAFSSKERHLKFREWLDAR